MKKLQENHAYKKTGADSLDAVELIMNIEDDLKFKFQMKATDIKTVGELVDFITKKIK